MWNEQDEPNDNVPRYNPSEWLPYHDFIVSGLWPHKRVYRTEKGKFSIISVDPPLGFLTDDEEMKRFKTLSETKVRCIRKS